MKIKGSFSGFGTSSATTGGGLFSNQKPSFGTSFGQTSTTTNFGSNLGSFGTNTGTSGGLFNNNNNQKPSFNFNSTSTGNTGGSLFNSNLGSFGANNANNLQAAQTNNTQQQLQQQVMLLSQNPYGDSPLFNNLKNADPKKKEEVLKPTNPSAQKAAISPAFNPARRRSTPRSTSRIRPKPLNSSSTGNSLFDGLEEEEDVSNTSVFSKKSDVKKLVLKKKANGGISTPNLSINKSPADSTIDLSVYAEGKENEKAEEKKAMNTSLNVLDNSVRKVLDITESEETTEVQFTRLVHPSGLKLNRCDYYTIPKWEDLVNNVDDQKRCIVENFLIGRHGYGNVYFHGQTDITGLDLDDLVHFRKHEVTVYPNDENKPEVGKGLNKRAQITLDGVWPIDKTTQSPIKDYERLMDMRYAVKLERATLKMDGKFLDYRPETGSWVFEVKHFTRYGLADDDDDEDLANEVIDKKLKIDCEDITGSKLKEKEIFELIKDKETEKNEDEPKKAVEIVEEGFSPYF